MSETIVVARDLTKHFTMKGGWGRPARTLRAVDGVSFEINAGETLGLVGESGSGKSTTGRLLVGLLPATRGSVRLFGHEIAEAGHAAAIEQVRRKVQFVFQDPQGSLDPRMRVEDAIAEPLDVAGGLTRKDRADRVRELIGLVGLPRDCGERFPHEFSGGQRQRIGIARALALHPAFIVCDEPVSALDVSMQAQVVNLLLDLQERLGLSYLFIAHDLAVVRNVSTRVAVMYAGSIVEIAERRALYASPRHPYTQALLAAVPRPQPNRVRARTVVGELPSLLDAPAGCAFHTRCPHATERCRTEPPQLRAIADGHLAACHLEVPAAKQAIPLVPA
jgi:oligopeptide/dipeptide ABC transporter ATP-binding protein